jgi:hypothetical protein
MLLLPLCVARHSLQAGSSSSEWRRSLTALTVNIVHVWPPGLSHSYNRDSKLSELVAPCYAGRCAVQRRPCGQGQMQHCSKPYSTLMIVES